MQKYNINGGSVFEKVKEACILLDSVCIYRNLLRDPVVHDFYVLLNAAAGISAGTSAPSGPVSCYAAFFNSLATYQSDLNIFLYMITKILLDENPFSKWASSDVTGKNAEHLLNAAGSDLRALQAAAFLTSAEIKECLCASQNYPEQLKEVMKRMPEWPCHSSTESKNGTCPAFHKMPAQNIIRRMLNEEWSSLACELAEFYRRNGCGMFVQYPAFVWQRSEGKGRLVPVSLHDPVRLSDLIAYESEREEVVCNTEQFLKGYPANNVLLYGDRGTGKSSTVKAILNEYHEEGLRMVEVPAGLLSDFPEIVSKLSGGKLKFIIFVDDLVFDDHEENYTSLKAALEGGLEMKPQNVLIYATSNRRHLIRERFSDRSGLQYGSGEDEIRASDTLQEKLSLSDRFGITVVFSSPDKSRYLRIVDKLAEKRGLGMDKETLHREALKWELWYNGRSPRTACQFISWIEGSSGK